MTPPKPFKLLILLPAATPLVVALLLRFKDGVDCVAIVFVVIFVIFVIFNFFDIIFGFFFLFFLLLRFFPPRRWLLLEPNPGRRCVARGLVSTFCFVNLSINTFSILASTASTNIFLSLANLFLSERTTFLISRCTIRSKRCTESFESFKSFESIESFESFESFLLVDAVVVDVVIFTALFFC